MAKLVSVYKPSEDTIRRRQLPLIVDGLTLVMDLNSMDLVCDNRPIRGKELAEFTQKMNLLSQAEVKSALQVSLLDIQQILDAAVPCIGCRRSVERFFFQLMTSGYPTLHPLVIKPNGVLTIGEDTTLTPQFLCTLFHGHITRLNNLVDSQPRSKKSRRCLLHSLDSQRSRPMTTAWKDVWDCMDPVCKEEVVVVETATLHGTLENYLRKHRFCGECRTKVLRAYHILVDEPQDVKDAGFISELYDGFNRCPGGTHIHVDVTNDCVADVILRAEPELMGSRRERHAKTMEIAQEEVMICMGICVYEKLHRVYMRLREDECTCQVLAAVAVNSLYRSFETAVEVKRGVSQLELLYEEITREEQLKIQRKEQKKLKRRRKKERRAVVDEKENCEDCLDIEMDDNSNESLDATLCSCINIAKPVIVASSIKKRTDETIKEKSISKNKYTDCEKIYCSVSCKESNVIDEKNPDRPVKFVSKKKLINRKQGCSETNRDKKCNNNIIEKHSLSLSPCQSCLSETDTIELSRKKTKNCNSGTKFNGGWSSGEQSQDCGYSSENNICSASGSSSLVSSPEGSEVACSEGFCNHEGECHLLDRSHSDCQDYEHCNGTNAYPTGGLKLTLQQMLDSCSSDNDGEESFIPAEEVMEFKSKVHHINEKRQELRQTLKTRFAQLCFGVPQSANQRGAESVNCSTE